MLADQLADIDHRATAQVLNDILAQAAKKRWSHTQLLEHIVRIEVEERTRRGLVRRFKRSHLDWCWPKQSDCDAVEALRSTTSSPSRAMSCCGGAGAR